MTPFDFSKVNNFLLETKKITPKTLSTQVFSQKILGAKIAIIVHTMHLFIYTTFYLSFYTFELLE
jgi:hypothetical protein